MTIPTYKIIIVGDNGVGKYAFLNMLISHLFKSDVKMTIGVDFAVKTLEIDGKKIKLQIWHLGGEERLRFLLPTYARGTNGALFMYDVTNYSSLAHIDDWLLAARKEIKSEQEVFPIIVVGNKADLEDKREVVGEEGINIARSMGVDGFIECSAKTGENVEETIDALTRLMMQRSRILIEKHSQNTIEIPKLAQRKKTKFKVNEYLTLRLEKDKTNIYVDEKLFKQCKYLLLNVPIDNNKDYNEIESIDEAAGKLDNSMERSGVYNRKLTPETEFWGHCSNMQAWYENDYDTRMIHRYLAFPLLKALMKAGDRNAKRVFKEEIARRIESGHPSTVWYLIYEGYLEYFNREELNTILKKPKFIKNLPKWYLENCIPKWLTKRIKVNIRAIFNDLKCPYCNTKIKKSSIQRILKGESLRCEFCYSNLF